MRKNRGDTDLPRATSVYGWRFHHLGIPTSEKRSNEKYIEKYKMYVSGFETSDFGIEWMRFEADSPISELIQTIPHLAFEVDDLNHAVAGKEIIGTITSPSPGIRVAMIIENGAPIELLEFNQYNRDTHKKHRNLSFDQ
jgi:hypothetical protein